MATLIYTGITSLDGYLADADGNFDWAEPDEEVHRFVNGLERPIGTYLYGRRTYELMHYWDTAHTEPDQPEYVREFTDIWQAADKVVYSTTLDAPSTARTRLERDFDPEAIRDLLASAGGDVSIAGAELAAHAIRAGLVDEIRQFLVPVLVGGGTRFFPAPSGFDWPRWPNGASATEWST